MTIEEQLEYLRGQLRDVQALEREIQITKKMVLENILHTRRVMTLVERLPK